MIVLDNPRDDWPLPRIVEVYKVLMEMLDLQKFKCQTVCEAVSYRTKLTAFYYREMTLFIRLSQIFLFPDYVYLVNIMWNMIIRRGK